MIVQNRSKSIVQLSEKRIVLKFIIRKILFIIFKFIHNLAALLRFSHVRSISWIGRSAKPREQLKESVGWDKISSKEKGILVVNNTQRGEKRR